MIFKKLKAQYGNNYTVLLGISLCYKASLTRLFSGVVGRPIILLNI